MQFIDDITGLVKGFVFGTKKPYNIYVQIYLEAEKLGYDGHNAISKMTWNEILLMQENKMPVFTVTKEIQQQAYYKTLDEITKEHNQKLRCE